MMFESTQSEFPRVRSMVVRKSWPLINDLTISERMSIVKLVFFANLFVKFANSFCDAGKKTPDRLGNLPGAPKQ